MLTIVFYATNGQAAKLRAREIAAQSKSDYSRCYDVGVWDGSNDKCDAVDIMPDVSKWQRGRIREVFGEKVRDYEETDQEPQEIDEPFRKSLGLMPERDDPATEPSGLKAVHKGGGRWFVMNGDERVSGPHDKAEAIRLAEPQLES